MWPRIPTLILRMRKSCSITMQASLCSFRRTKKILTRGIDNNVFTVIYCFCFSLSSLTNHLLVKFPQQVINSFPSFSHRSIPAMSLSSGFLFDRKHLEKAECWEGHTRDAMQDILHSPVDPPHSSTASRSCLETLKSSCALSAFLISDAALGKASAGIPDHTIQLLLHQPRKNPLTFSRCWPLFFNAISEWSSYWWK